MNNIKIVSLSLCTLLISACATLTNTPNVAITLSFSDGSKGTCSLENKRYDADVTVPNVASVRRSDDVLLYNCETEDGRQISGFIESIHGPKIVVSGLFFGSSIIDAITDKHREYPESYVIPVR